jgi:hypothetical protein
MGKHGESMKWRTITILTTREQLYASKISKISMGKLESGDIQAIREKVGRLGESRMSDMMKAIDSL